MCSNGEVELEIPMDFIFMPVNIQNERVQEYLTAKIFDLNNLRKQFEIPVCKTYLNSKLTQLREEMKHK